MKLHAKQRLLATNQPMQLTAADARAVLRKIKPTLNTKLVDWLRKLGKAKNNPKAFFALIDQGVPAGNGDPLNKQYAKICKEILQCASLQIKDATHENDSDAPEMVAMYLGDAADMIEVAILLNKGDVKKALKKAYHMDSAPRDSLPDSFYDLEGTK